MNTKMIVCDMDGTLLNSKKSISEKTRETLIAAQKAGITLVLASGRSYRTLLHYSDELEMIANKGYFITANGTSIYDLIKAENKAIKRFSVSEAEEIFSAVKAEGVEVIYVTDTTLFSYIPKQVYQLKKEFRMANNIADDVPWTSGIDGPIRDSRDLYDHFIYIEDLSKVDLPMLNKVCVSYPDAKVIKDLEAKLIEKFGDKYNFGCSSATWLEITPSGISKGNTLLKLIDQLKINNEEVLVFGDAENDRSMFETFKYSLAMGNAMESI
ncbi:MAG: HAD family hydrolase, partial [Erysipelotrichaceae bacterium]